MLAPLYDGHADAYQANPEFEGHIAAALTRSLSQNPSRVVMIDRAGARRPIRAGALLAIASMLGEAFKKIPEKRVGVVLPPGLGGAIANCALMFADKIPVNLNFTSGRAALESCIAQSGIGTILTAGPMRERLPDFPWTDSVLDIRDCVAGLSKPKTMWRIACAYALRGDQLIRRWGVPEVGGDREAALLFTSGSAGEPKGVPLTHRNILGNVRQIIDFQLFCDGDSALGCLPLFHSFGYTVTLWLPLIGGFPVVTVPSPFDIARNLDAIREENITILLGSPTFLRPYLKRAKPDAIPSVKCVVAGAEKTPPGFGEQWEQYFGSYYLEGYGLTETTPVVGVNLPPLPGKPFEQWNRRGSIGRLLPGQDVRIVDPDTGKDLGFGEQGLLYLKGVNIFTGYLDNPEATAEVLHEGWFNTGDLARLDRDGFLFVDGRLSRFSKIGGEKVPHGTVEAAVLKALGLDHAASDLPVVAVANRRDRVKGETLVLLSTMDVDMAALRDLLSKDGLPNLWIPRICKRVDKIPVLASGKFDLKRLGQLAQD